ncbi:MAG TPA: hypothetical protein VFT95_10480 [Micromonosporaceae bacterium]|nr:hypothetical protein [Micromonosporaceae bacterium]
MIDEQAARAIAAAEAAQAYHDLSGYTVTARLVDGCWHVDYELTDRTLLGGGPHFVIDAGSGEITGRRYEQ